MTVQEYLQLQSQKEFLKHQLEKLPATALLTRSSMESQMQVVEQRLEFTDRPPGPRVAVLTFRGKPVVASQGIFAEFGARATEAFIEAVVTTACSLAGPVASAGPLPGRDQFRFLITGTATGSFGFTLEEHSSGASPVEEQSIAAHALEMTCSLLEISARGTDEELADCVSAMNPRSIEAIRGFLNLLAADDAACTLVLGRRNFAFQDLSEVRRSLTRLDRDHLHEQTRTLSGKFIGVLPKARTFEFELADSAEIIRGKIELVVDVDLINRHLMEAAEVEFQETKVGNGKPRYRLQQPPRWITAGGSTRN